MKRSRGGLRTIFAFMLATVAALVAYSFAVGGTDEPAQPLAAVAVATEVPTTSVVVLTKDLAAATVLTKDMVTVRQMPLDAVSSKALSNTEQAVGKTTTVPLARGEQLLETRLTPGGTNSSTFAGIVPVGYRAISFVFDEVQGVGGMVQPGDHVDVVAFWTFKIKAKDAITSSSSPDGTNTTTADTSDTADDQSGGQEFDQSVSAYIVQNVEVLAVAQALSPEQAGLQDESNLPAQESTDASTQQEELNGPKVRPGAKSVTIAATPEQAQRMLLAAQSVSDKQQGTDTALRLIVRAPGDTTTIDLPPVQLGNLPEEYRDLTPEFLLGDVYQSSLANDLVITDATFEKKVLNQGETLYFTATVKNISNETIKSSDKAPPEYTYTQGTAYDTLGFFPAENTYRIGLNVSGAFPTEFPYRWSLGRDLEPGETTRISGSVQLTEPVPDATYWLGVIQEPNVVTQDGVGVTHVLVNAASEISVDTRFASILEQPDVAAPVVKVVADGTKLSVMEAHGPWFRVRLGSEDGWIAAGAITVEPAPEITLDGPLTTNDQETLLERGRQLIPWTREESK